MATLKNLFRFVCVSALMVKKALMEGKGKATSLINAEQKNIFEKIQVHWNKLEFYWFRNDVFDGSPPAFSVIILYQKWGRGKKLISLFSPEFKVTIYFDSGCSGSEGCCCCCFFERVERNFSYFHSFCLCECQKEGRRSLLRFS